MVLITKNNKKDMLHMLKDCESCNVTLYKTKSNEKLSLQSDMYHYIVLVHGTMLVNNRILHKWDYACLKKKNSAEMYADCIFLHITFDSPSDNIFKHYCLADHRPLFNKGIFKIVPNKILGSFGSGQLYPLVGPQPISLGADYIHRGPDNFILILTKNKIGDGPLIHKHLLSTEIFISLKGKFKVTVDNNEYILEKFDTIVIEKYRYRNFKALENDSVLLPIVLGTNDESKDIIFPKSVTESFKGWKKNYLRAGKLFGLKIEKE